MDFDDLPHEAWNKELVKSVRARGKQMAKTVKGRKKLAQLEAKVQGEVDKRLACEARTFEEMNAEYGREGWRGGERHIIDQPGDVDGAKWEHYTGSKEGLIPMTDRRLLALLKSKGAGKSGVNEIVIQVSEHEWMGKLGLMSDHVVEMERRAWRPPIAMRVIDDMSKNLMNASVTSTDRLRCPPTDQPVRMGAKLNRQAEEQGLVGMGLGAGCEDVEAAFRKIWNAAPGFQVAVWFSISRGEVMCTAHYGGVFGAGANVNGFNVVTELGATVGRRLLGVVCDHHSDDMVVVATEMAGAAPQGALGRMMEGVGFGFKESKRKEFASATKFKGVVADFSEYKAHRRLSSYVEETRKLKIVARCQQNLKSLSPAAARSIVGKCLFVDSWSGGKHLRSSLQPLNVRAQEETAIHSVKGILKNTMEYLIENVPKLKKRTVQLGKAAREPLLVWTDAMYDERKQDGGFVVIDREAGEFQMESLMRKGKVYVAGGHTPREVQERFCPGQKTYIGQLEMAWATSPAVTLPHVFRRRQCLHFIDNVGAMAGLIKGYARRLDMALLTGGVHALLNELESDPYWEYVRSKANVSDLPSREQMGKTIEIVMRLGWRRDQIEIVTAKFPPADAWSAPSSAWVLAIKRRLEEDGAGGKEAKRRRR